MPRRSLESQRPIMEPSIASKRTSQRYSTYSNSPSFTSTYTNQSTRTDSSQAQGMQEIRNLTRGLDRLENKPLTQQRFVPTEQKSDTLSKLALGAKVERALGRRMTNQDAVHTSRRSEKSTSGMTMSTVNEKVSGVRG